MSQHFDLLYSSWGSHGKYPEVVCHSLHQWVTFCQNSLLWPVCLGWPCTAWLIASLSCTSSFTMTRQWFMKEKRASEDEIAGWHHRCNGHELGQTPGDGDGQGGLACCRPRGCKESTGRLNDNNWMFQCWNIVSQLYFKYVYIHIYKLKPQTQVWG